MVKTVFWAVSLCTVAIWLFLLQIGIHAYWLVTLWAIFTLIGLYDLNSNHNVLRNYPVIGHIRYLLEFIRPEIQQYFIASNQSDRPFSRELRSLVYQRSKKVRDTLPFGTQRDISDPGYHSLWHSLAPTTVNPETAFVIIGGPQCEQPYRASRLNISAMSFGALSHTAVLAMNMGAELGGFAQNTGEGGLTKEHLHGADVIWQIGTGYFGCRDADGRFDEVQFTEKANLHQVKMIEIKLSQGAKPAHGGILPAAKVSPEIAAIRGITPGEDCISPPKHSSFDSPLGLLEFVARLRKLSDGKPVGFKLCLGDPNQFMAICKAMLETHITPDFITIDGAEGGTGAAPIEFTNRFGWPINQAINYAHNCLVGCGLRDQICLIASGKVATGFDMVEKISLGADTCNAARSMMFAVGCIQALRCDANTCPTGVTTQDKKRASALVPEHKKVHIKNFHQATITSFLDLLGAMGYDHPNRLSANDLKIQSSNYHHISWADDNQQLTANALLDGKADDYYAKPWQQAVAERF